MGLFSQAEGSEWESSRTVKVWGSDRHTVRQQTTVLVRLRVKDKPEGDFQRGEDIIWRPPQMPDPPDLIHTLWHMVTTVNHFLLLVNTTHWDWLLILWWLTGWLYSSGGRIHLPCSITFQKHNNDLFLRKCSEVKQRNEVKQKQNAICDGEIQNHPTDKKKKVCEHNKETIEGGFEERLGLTHHVDTSCYCHHLTRLGLSLWEEQEFSRSAVIKSMTRVLIRVKVRSQCRHLKGLYIGNNSWIKCLYSWQITSQGALWHLLTATVTQSVSTSKETRRISSHAGCVSFHPFTPSALCV